jgi:hypothetical protein
MNGLNVKSPAPKTMREQFAPTPVSVRKARWNMAGQKFFGVVVCIVCFIARAASAQNRLVVHEWGTFTSFQDESGRALHHINTDDEPVPDFVHQLGREFEFRPTEMPPRLSQGAPHAHPQVTMRLETPVLYFHLPESAKPMTVDVAVEFHGGWLTQYYPAAAARVDGNPVVALHFPVMTTQSVGKLIWNGVKVGGEGEGPITEQKVWLAPRNVNAANVLSKDERERFLFYRGVGGIDAPLKVARSSDGKTLEINQQGALSEGMNIRQLWLADIKPDGAVAFRTVTLAAGSTPATFAPEDYAIANLPRLRGSMHEALVKEGLFADEADALLNTWELSYFQSPGLRLFFLVPEVWTNSVLPLKLSVDADVKRIMVGRIELVTPHQRELLEKIAGAPLPNLAPVTQAMQSLRKSNIEKYNALASGRGNPDELGVEVPDSYRDFLALGRFRTALLLNRDPSRESIAPLLGDFRIEVELPGTKMAQQIRDRRAAGQ